MSHRRDHYLWPAGIALFLLAVVLVNAAMIAVAVDGADTVAPSYQHGPR